VTTVGQWEVSRVKLFVGFGMILIGVVAVSCVSSVDVRYILQDGYRGPVIVVWDVSDGMDVRSDGSGSLEIAIPANGAVRSRADPSEGGQRLRFYFADGSEIPFEDDTAETYIFGYISGSERRGESEWNYDAFVVGRPEGDWQGRRSVAVSAALWQ
jgi:hypothetical protein